MNRGSRQNALSFPGGNDGIGRHLVKTLIPEAIQGPRTVESIYKNQVDFSALDQPGQTVRIRLGSTVAGVEHEGEPSPSQFVSVMDTRKGKEYCLKARAGVMAGGPVGLKKNFFSPTSAPRAAYQ